MRIVTRFLRRALRSLAARDSDYYMQPSVAATTPADDENDA